MSAHGTHGYDANCPTCLGFSCSECAILETQVEDLEAVILEFIEAEKKYAQQTVKALFGKPSSP